MIRAPRLQNFGKRLRNREERGAALVEFAIAIPIFIGLIAIIFDVGLGYTTARSSSSAARSAARIGALAGNDRAADFQILDALRAQFGDGDQIQSILVYRSDAIDNPTGKPPAECNASTDCNSYTGAQLETLSLGDFTTANAGLPTESCGGAPDANWCPLDRRDDADDYLGVFIKTTSDPTFGALSPDSFDIEDRAVFALYFPPIPPTPVPTVIGN